MVIFSAALFKYRLSTITICWVLLACFTVTTLCGCGITQEEKSKVITIIHNNNRSDFEQKMQNKIKTDNRIKYYSGNFDWRIESTRDKGIYVAKYGYFGRPVWWRIIIGFCVEIVTKVLTLGFFSYNPYSIEKEGGIFYTLFVDINSNTVTWPAK